MVVWEDMWQRGGGLKPGQAFDGKFFLLGVALSSSPLLSRLRFAQRRVLKGTPERVCAA